MRVTSDFFVSALVRRVFGQGGFAAIVRKGAAEAGAIFIAVRDREGTTALYGPAPQTGYSGSGAEGRRFMKVMETPDEQAIGDRVQREVRFDPDAWLVEIEAREPADQLFEVMPS